MEAQCGWSPGRSGGHNVKTLAQHALEGTTNVTRHSGYSNPELPEGAPDIPPGLIGEALAEWGRITGELAETGALSRVDRVVLARYCDLWARSEAINIWLRVEPLTYEKVTIDGAGQELREVRKHPLLVEARLLDQVVKAYVVEFGLTPASPGRVKLPERPDEDDPFAEFETKAH